MSALLTTLALQTVLLTSPLQSSQAQGQSDDFAALYTNVERAIQTRYYGRTSRRDEMNTILSKYRNQAANAKDRKHFTTVVDEMIAAFDDSHFEFLPNHRQAYYAFDSIAREEAAEPMPHIGVWFTKTENGYRVKMLMEGSTADTAGLRHNDIITQIEGQPFTPIESLRPHLDKTAEITFLRNGKEYKTQVMPKAQSALDMFFEGTRNSARVETINGQKVGYVRIWTMVDRKFRDFLEFYVTRGAGKDTDAFVYDIRDGFGGRPEGYYEPFFAPELTLSWKIGTLTTSQITGYQKPLVLLTNPGTRSAKEVVSQIFKTSKRATIVGGPSAGDVLGTTPYKVADWAYLEIPMVELTVDGQTLEKNPVLPDLPYGQEFSAEGEDLYLPKALEEAAKQASQITR